MKESRVINAVPTKKWRLHVKTGVYSTTAKEYDHEPTSEDVQAFIKYITPYSEVKLEIFYS